MTSEQLNHILNWKITNTSGFSFFYNVQSHPGIYHVNPEVDNAVISYMTHTPQSSN